ncbi:hypothetical protein QBC46DRAFT_401836 [Diplogelasinospora grovesii]|uniref:Uncharacterized protein n=1 Tax=Diplogelasinospora grovesii TaxID=303347 RepID=A0AAN6MVZ4_9PEZI|nr:hypothetical protein QBC46DRAFT_401836 [Diplogelasinospora grovesii]
MHNKPSHVHGPHIVSSNPPPNSDPLHYPGPDVRMHNQQPANLLRRPLPAHGGTLPQPAVLEVPPGFRGDPAPSNATTSSWDEQQLTFQPLVQAAGASPSPTRLPGIHEAFDTPRTTLPACHPRGAFARSQLAAHSPVLAPGSASHFADVPDHIFVPPFTHLIPTMCQISRVLPEALRWARHSEVQSEPTIEMDVPTTVNDGYMYVRVDPKKLPNAIHLSNETPIPDAKVRSLFGDVLYQATESSECWKRGEPATVYYAEGGKTPFFRLTLGFDDVLRLTNDLFAASLKVKPPA